MTVGSRITLLAAILCLMTTAISAYAIITIWKIQKSSESITEDSIPGIIDSGSFNTRQAENQIRSTMLCLAETEEERKTLQKEIKANSELNEATLKSYEASIFEEEDKANFEAVRQARLGFIKTRTEYYALLNSDKAAARNYLFSKLMPEYGEYSKKGDVLLNYNTNMGKSRAASIHAQVNFAERALLIMGISALILGVLISVLSTRAIILKLKEIITTLSEGSDQTVSAAGQVSTASQTLASGASEQAASLEETSASLEEIGSMTQRNAENAQKAKTLASQARQAADTGVTDIVEMNEAMQKIRESSDDISKIIKTIDEIAFQTNILALNAAVEAARAGEAGAGFAVVAEEVRSLAQRAASAARETGGKIEGAITRTKRGSDLNQKVSTSLEDIAKRVREVDSLIQEIATASHEQSQGISQVGTAVSQMDKVTQSNAASAEESASAAEQLNAQAHTLKQIVGQLAALAGVQSNA